MKKSTIRYICDRLIWFIILIIPFICALGLTFQNKGNFADNMNSFYSDLLIDYRYYVKNDINIRNIETFEDEGQTIEFIEYYNYITSYLDNLRDIVTDVNLTKEDKQYLLGYFEDTLNFTGNFRELQDYIKLPYHYAYTYEMNNTNKTFANNFVNNIYNYFLDNFYYNSIEEITLNFDLDNSIYDSFYNDFTDKLTVFGGLNKWCFNYLFYFASIEIVHIIFDIFLYVIKLIRAYFDKIINKVGNYD